MKITYFGHSCLLLELSEKKILIDPFLSGNPLAKDLDVNSIACDYIFPTHAHSDHIGDLEVVARNNPGVTIVAIWEISDYFSKKGFQCHPMNKGGWWTFDFGRVKMVQAVHSSSFPDGSYGGEPVGFVFDTPEGVVYVAGDTALTYDMQLIPITCPSLDLAILPIGSNFTMDVHDALIASDFVQCNRVLGCHYDSFGFIKIDQQAAWTHFAEKGKELILLQPGESLNLKD
jgi:L-ascorbate metabolism protein UlaG (beta-lactamase superfamily)